MPQNNRKKSLAIMPGDDRLILDGGGNKFASKNERRNMQKATVFLNREGAIALKAHRVGVCGADAGLGAFGWLLAYKHAAQSTPVEAFQKVEVFLPNWAGDLKERAAVGLGLRKKSARFIERVEMV